MELKEYPTLWQSKMMWAALSAFFVVMLITIACSLVWIAANLISFIQPILIPVAIAVILAYLLDPVVTKMTKHGLSRAKAVWALFAIAFLSIGVLITWLAPVVSMQAANVTRELPQYTLKARDRVVDLIFRYDQAFGNTSGKKGASPASGFINWLLASPTPSAPAGGRGRPADPGGRVRVGEISAIRPGADGDVEMLTQLSMVLADPRHR